MVNGNYIMYGDRPVSDIDIVDDHIASRTVERRPRRKGNRTASELQHTLSLAQLENETDSIKHERSKEPRLLRYVPTTDVEEHYVSDKFETYDLKPSEATPRRYAFKKKPRNPADGSVNYAYSRSSSSCSSPSGNLPPIAEHEPRRSPPSPPPAMPGYESKLDKYFTKPKEHKSFAAKGSHPDSLYRVPAGSGARAGKLARALRLMRWPVALVVVCVALAVFVYFLMPDNFRPIETDNGTYWESNVADADTHRSPESVYRTEARDRANAKKQETRTPEIDFYDAENNKNDNLDTENSEFVDEIPQKKLPVPPVFPTHLTPEVQYGNENADTGNLRSPKILHQANAVAADSTLKPHITQKPEKPLAIYFKDGKGVMTTTTTEAINRAAKINNYDKTSNNKHADVIKNNKHDLGLVPWPVNKAHVTYDSESVLPPEIQEYYPRVPLKTHLNFTSGHSKLFGISIEDAKNMHSTTQSSVYNTRVSPTLPTWRDGDDTTTKNYPVPANHDVSQCRSTSLPLCRGVLPYDLASKPAMSGGASIRTLLPHIEYVASTNCSSRFRSFVCVFLEPECSPPPLVPKKPCYSFCKAIADSCESEIPRELDAMFICEQYSRTECVAARAPCSVRELACGDGSCVPREWICNGRADCPAGEDEAPCHSCDANEFRCSSGTCIHKRWVCDGYADCPDGDDEAAAECGADGASTEPGEESAGSAPAPAVHRPNKVSRLRSKAGDIESSKELLMTSESSNAVKRNFTRRPLLSRLTPYSPPMRQRQDKDKNLRAAKADPKVEVQKDNDPKRESKEDINVDDLGLFGDVDEDNDNQPEMKAVNKSKFNLMHGRAPLPPRDDLGLRSFDTQPDSPQPTKLDKTINKLEFVLDGASLLKKAAESQKTIETEYQDSVENTTTFVSPQKEVVTEKQKSTGPFSVVKQSAHASPCPSGELRCVDGRCITLAQLCDGSIDCSDHADEDNCYT